MHVPALAILIALIPLSATAGDAFRAHLTNYVTAHTGCAGSRTLVERELAGFERGRAGDAPASLTLFGKRAATWTEEDIRDLLAVIRTCEETGGRHFAEDGEPRLVERLDDLARSMRRAVLLSTQSGQGPSQAPIAPPPGRDDPPEDGDGRSAAAQTGRRSQRPAFTPADTSRAATVTGAVADHGRGTPPSASAWTPSEPPAASEPPTESRAAPEPARGTTPRAVSAAGSAARPAAPSMASDTVRSTGAAFQSLAGPGERQPEPCAVTRERFARIRAGMTPMEVEAVFGCRGRLESATAIEGVGTFEVYVWSPPNQSGSATVTFQDRRLKAKALRRS
ncbi:hypothetical protein [Methylorubrum suomiense]|uniref:hypothetical protein n=1 Tax=Methylorubrum suomiense TaxID=144191 RepID=UPI0036399665